MKYIFAVLLIGAVLLSGIAAYYYFIPDNEIFTSYIPDIFTETATERAAEEITEKISKEEVTEENFTSETPVDSTSDDVNDIPDIMRYRYYSLSESEREACDVLLEVLKDHKEKYTLDKSFSKDDMFTAWYNLADMSDYVIITDPTMTITYDINLLNMVKAITPEYNYSAQEYEKRYSECMSIVESIVAQTEGMSDYDKAKYFHDYLVLNTEYNDADISNPHSALHSAYSCIVNKEAVCDGYAGAYKILCENAGIPCEIVSGYAKNNYENVGVGESHAWNIVYLDGNWYHTDVTWDDPTGMDKDYITYAYFNIPYEEMLIDHTVVDGIPMPNSYSYDMDYYTKSGRLIESDDDMRYVVSEGISDTISEGKYLSGFKFTDEESYNEAVESFQTAEINSFFDIISQTLYETLQIYYEIPFSYSLNDEKHIITIQFYY